MGEDGEVPSAVRWPWSKAPPAPAIPAYRPPITRQHSQEREDEGLVVEEVDTSDMTKTGVHRAWKRLTAQAE